MIEAHFREELGDSDRRFGKRLLPTIWREDGEGLKLLPSARGGTAREEKVQRRN
jgi:hypothetical protein